jgi:hypothetical protein
VNNSPLTGVHFAKHKSGTTAANPICCQISHRAQLGFAGRAKPFNVTDKVLAIRKSPSERLVDQMLDGLQEFPAFSL